MSTVKISGQEAIAKTLKRCGIQHFFCVPGGFNGAFYTALEDEGLNIVVGRNEKAACNMADGYSRVTNRPSICYSQHGAAAAMLSSMLYESMYAHSPVVALTGSIPTSVKDRWTYQECYEMSYFDPTCKFNVDVTDTSRLSEYLRTAIQAAVSGCPGPTHVNIHLDMASKISEMPEIYDGMILSKIPFSRTRAEPDRILEAIKLLVNAKRPVIICGSGIHLSGAYEQLRKLVELLSIPIATNVKGRGCFPEGHPLFIGVTGSYGQSVTNDIIRESDIVFFVGTRAEPNMTDGLTAPEPGKSGIIHLDIESMVIGRNYKTEVPLVGDCMATLEEMLSIIETKMRRPQPNEKRLQEITKGIEKYNNNYRASMDSDISPIKPQRIMKEVMKIIRDRDIIVSDTGNMLCWTSRLLKLKGVGRTFIPCGGTMGSSFSEAIGAAFGAEEDQRVLNLIGDGGIMYNIGELETLKRYVDKHVPFVALVNNNSSFSQVRPSLDDMSKEDTPWIEITDFTDTDFAKVAQGFGCYGVTIERPSEIAEAIQNAFKSGKPAIVNVISDKREYAPVKYWYPL